VSRGALLFLLAYALGFVAAIPVGGSQIEIAKRAIGGQLAAAGLVAVGSASSDMVYGVIALFGIAPIMERPGVLAAFDVVGAALLWVLAVVTLRRRHRVQPLGQTRAILAGLGGAYLTGFVLAFSNPPMILTWLLGVALAKRVGLASPFPVDARALFIAGGVLGLGSYQGLLAGVLYRVKHFIPVAAFDKVYLWLGIALWVLSFYFIYGAVQYFYFSR
jgi:threonine/homoserine/homoserine lactone efflux protein